MPKVCKFTKLNTIYFYLLFLNTCYWNAFWQLGERKSGTHHLGTGKIQDYHELKDKCLRDGKLFEDDAFPASDASFYFSPGRGKRQFDWVRPSELVEKPLFISEGSFMQINYFVFK